MKKKNKKENKLSNLQNMFLFLESFLVLNLITFLFLIHFKQLKML
jgi:hypothetical protein